TATDITGATTHYTYNKDGTLKQAVQKTPDGKTLAEVAYTYDGLGRMQKAERGNKSITVYGYNDAGQITSDKTTRADGSVITEAAYTYDSHGNLTHRTDTRPETSQNPTTTTATSQGEGEGEGADGKNNGGAADAEAGGAGGGLGRDDKGVVKNATTSTAYRYDAYNRLTGSTLKDEAGKPLVETGYALNTSGDVTRTETTRHEGGRAKKTVTEHGIDAGGRLTAVTVDGDTKAQTWDAAGNLLTDHNGTVWTYNSSNQPLTATSPDGTTTAYTYWADGTRRDTVTTAKDGTTSRTGFYYTPDGTITNDTHTTGDGSGDGGSDGGGPVTASYLSAATREARTLTGGAGTDGAGAGYLLHDRHGNTTALTTTNQAAPVTAAWNYNDYGRHTTTTGTPFTTNAGKGAAAEGSSAAATAGGTAAVNPFTYSGEHTDTRLGTQYLKNRIYDTSQGRFTTRDTAPLHNRYQYADTNPITNTDPTGRTAVLDKIVSGVMIGVTILAAIVTVAITAATAGIGTALGVALAGAVLDTASAAVETAALATGNNQWDSPLNIAAYTLGAAGTALGVGAAIKAAARNIGKSVATEAAEKVTKGTPSGKSPVPAEGGTELSQEGKFQLENARGLYHATIDLIGVNRTLSGEAYALNSAMARGLTREEYSQRWPNLSHVGLKGTDLEASLQGGMGVGRSPSVHNTPFDAMQSIRKNQDEVFLISRSENPDTVFMAVRTEDTVTFFDAGRGRWGEWRDVAPGHHFRGTQVKVWPQGTIVPEYAKQILCR
ncbi:RHS repeat-associated core domain-containing protein, partial [Streptomyces sp. NPDC057910]|uniref:RHS repeat-associated core domain-containing protein n=1 Tax=Streptomyces sp. NPDC057910 TaxID=3346278 RepID=UPI0036E0244F